MGPVGVLAAISCQVSKNQARGVAAEKRVVAAELAATRKALRNKTVCEVVPDEADGVHDILSSRHHKGAHIFPSWLSAKVMGSELNRASKRLWEPIECAGHEGWHLVAGNQFFRIGR